MTDNLVSLITVLIMVGGFYLSTRSTSFNELKSLYENIRKDFEDYKETSEKKEVEYEHKVDNLLKENNRFKKYIARLIAQIERIGETPEKMDEE